MKRDHKLVRLLLSVERLEDRLCMSSMAIDTPLIKPEPDVAAQARAAEAYGQLPLSFEANQGQVDAQVNFLSRGSGYTLFLKPDEAVLALEHPSGASAQEGAGGATVLRMQIVGGNPLAQAVGSDKQTNTSNYFVGNDPSQWQTGIGNYGKVWYHNVYTGVDMVYYGNQRQLEYDFIVAPGVDPGAIRLAFQGVAGMELDSHGDLVLHTAGDDVVEHAPVLYQVSNGVRQTVSGSYVLESNGQVRFQLGAHDPARPLIIDPLFALVYSTYLGGSGGASQARGIAVDSSGDAYVTGFTSSTNFPTTSGAFQTSGDLKRTGYVGFVTKFNAAGSALLYSTYFSGASPRGIAVDSTGNAYVTGLTTGNLPTKNAMQATYGGGTYIGDVFVTKFNATGSALIYSTYLGGSGDDESRGIAVDSSGNAYVIGNTNSTNFPTTPGSLQPVIYSTYSGFAAELTSNGSALVYSTYLGSTYGIFGNAIAVDGSGNAYLTGQTNGRVATEDAYVAKLNGTGSAFAYFSYLGGGTSDEVGYRIAVDGSGDAYVMGATKSTDFPTTPGAFQTTYGGGGTDAFVAKFNSDGSALVYSTYLGGSGDEPFGAGSFNPSPEGGIAVDSSGKIYVTGITSSTNFPTKNALQATYGGGGYDAFVAELDPSQVGAASLVYSSYLGGSDQDVSYGIAVDGSGNAYVTGFTYSANFPTKNAFQPQITRPNGKHGANSDAFITKIDPPAASASTVSSGLTTAAAAAAAIRVSPMLPLLAPSMAGGQLSNEFSRMPQWASAPGMLQLAASSVASAQLPNEPSRMPPLASAPVGTAETVAATPAAHASPWEKPMTSRTALMDDVFARGDWLAQAVVGDLALAWIR